MGTFSRFEDIEAWQVGRELVNLIYQTIRENDFQRDFSLIDQIKRAALSIPTNIAEGYGRGSDREFAKFLSYASASAREVQSLAYSALDQGYIDEAFFETIYERSGKVSNQIASLIKYLNRSAFKSIRYKK